MWREDLFKKSSARQEKFGVSALVLFMLSDLTTMTTDQRSPLVVVGVADAAVASESSRGTNLNSTISSITVPTIVSCNQNEALLDALVTRVVNESIFPKKQFIILEKELESSSKLAESCLAALKMEKEQWDCVKNIVRKKLNRRRNNAQLCVRRALKGRRSIRVGGLYLCDNALTNECSFVLQVIWRSMELQPWT
jgi:hypothetical protein